MYTVNYAKARTEIIKCISKGLVPLLTSSPGMGKSSLVASIAKEHRLKLIDLRLTAMLPEDLSGFPMKNGNKATFTPFDIFPIEGDEVPDGYDGWLLFLDEFTSADKAMQAPSYKLVLDRMVGSHKLHQRVAMVAAGNKMTDKAIVKPLSTALQSRVIHYELEVSAKDWTEVAYKLGIDHRIIGFVNYMPSRLMDFRPDHHDKTFPCPRTWEFLSRLVEDEDIDPDIAARVAGTIGQGTGTEFITFAQEYERLPKLEDIIANPKGTQVPPEASTRYAVTSMLIDNFSKDNLSPVIDYVDRLDVEFRILFIRGVVAKDPSMHAQHAKFVEMRRNLSRYLQ